MTSQLRRKRQTIVQATQTTILELPWTILTRGGSIARIAGAVILFVAIFALLWGPAVAIEPGSTQSQVVPVNYTTTSSDGLVWLPYRPTAGELRKDRRDSKVIAAGFQTPSEPTAKAGDNPMADPFGDMRVPKERPHMNRPSLAVEKKPYSPEFVDPTTIPDDPESLAQNGTDTSRVPPSQIPEAFLEQGIGAEKGKPEPLPTLDEELAKNVIRNDGCPESDSLKPISELTTDVRASGTVFPKECAFDETTFSPRAWTPTTFTWKASGLCHKPLYFEDVQLERYGHSFGPYVQPLISHAHFFVTVPVLPYKMGVNPPNECMYTLGYYRPGSCAPYMLDPLPISVRGALWETAAVLGAVYLLP